MKYLNDTGLSHLMDKLRTNAKVTKTEYVYVTPNQMMVSFTIPNFDASKQTLDVYINGLMCIPDVDYTLSNNVCSLTKELDANQTCYFVVRSVSL